jgi:hypothetical protein
VADGASAAWDTVQVAFGDAMGWLGSIVESLSDIGANMMLGLANGIASNASAVVAAITGAVGGAIDAAKKLLHIASPSRVFAQIGGHTAAGFAEGIDDGAGDVSQSASAMATGAVDAASVSVGASKGSSNSAGPIALTINVSGGDALELARKVRLEVEAFFEEQGLLVAGAA